MIGAVGLLLLDFYFFCDVKLSYGGGGMNKYTIIVSIMQLICFLLLAFNHFGE
jgi:hypothetical protein